MKTFAPSPWHTSARATAYRIEAERQTRNTLVARMAAIRAQVKA